MIASDLAFPFSAQRHKDQEGDEGELGCEVFEMKEGIKTRGTKASRF